MIFFDKMTIPQLKSEYDFRMTSNYYQNVKINTFKEIIITLSDNNVNDFAEKLNTANEGLPVTIKTTKDSFRKSLNNWKNGKGCPPFVKNLHKKEVNKTIDNRAKFIDLLLYLGLHKKYKNNLLNGFNSELRKFGIEPLYELDFFDFCVAVGIYLEEKNGTNAYITFRRLYGDKTLKRLAEIDISGKGTFTLKIKEDFDKIENVGCITDIYEDGKIKREANIKNAYQFVLLYASEFGRRHISRYFAYAALLNGCDVDYIINEIKTKKKKDNLIFKNSITGELQKSTLKEAIRDQLVVEQVQHSLYLMGEKMLLSCAEYLHEDYVHLYNENHLDLHFDDVDKPSRFLSAEEKTEQIKSHKKNHGNIQSGQILDISSSDFSKMIEKDENISREMILMTLLTTISTEIIKKYVDRFEDDDSARDKMIDSINRMLHQCRMAELDEEISQYDFLLLLAIYKTNCSEILEDKSDQYPYRKFVFSQFL